MTINNKKDVADKYKKLTEVQHVLARPGRYIGSINKEKSLKWMLKDNIIITKEVNVVPAFHKLFDEIISNSADHARTKEGANLNRIDVTVDSKIISVLDNGGIPVIKHPEYDQYIPDMIFGELRSGSNFDDDEDSLSTGQNGEGSSLTNIFSKVFTVETALDGKKLKIVYSNNMSERTEPTILTSNKNFTKITYEPDLSRFNMDEITEDDIALIERRTYEVAFTNPNLKVYFNGKRCEIDSFEKFVKLYNPDSVLFTSERWKVGLAFSENGYNHISYVNSTPSYDGGTHVDYVSGKIIDAVRAHIEKKTKQKIRPQDIRNNLSVLIDCNINNPRYNSQTKEKLITPPNQFGSQFEPDDKFIKKLLASNIVKDIIEWANRKKDMEELKDIEDREKSIKTKGFHDIENYRSATSRRRDECMLFLCEGQSASKPLLAASNPKIHGVLPLKGKPENCFAKTLSQVVSQEFMNISRILNLSITKPDYSQMRYSKVIIATDADHDGQHILGLMILLFRKFWPELLDNGQVQYLVTPSVIVTMKGKKYNFVTEAEYDEWIIGKSGFTTKYCKGLGGHKTPEFKTFIEDENSFITINYDHERDGDLVGMAFDPKRADDRKQWVAVI